MTTNNKYKYSSRAVHTPYSLPYENFQFTKNYKNEYELHFEYDTLLCDLCETYPVIQESFIPYYNMRIRNWEVLYGDKDEFVSSLEKYKIINNIINHIGYDKFKTINYAARCGMYLWLYKNIEDKDYKDTLYKRFLWMRWIAYSNKQLSKKDIASNSTEDIEPMPLYFG
jgi:hypothetical protein